MRASREMKSICRAMIPSIRLRSAAAPVMVSPRLDTTRARSRILDASSWPITQGDGNVSLPEDALDCFALFHPSIVAITTILMFVFPSNARRGRRIKFTVDLTEMQELGPLICSAVLSEDARDPSAALSQSSLGAARAWVRHSRPAAMTNNLGPADSLFTNRGPT